VRPISWAPPGEPDFASGPGPREPVGGGAPLEVELDRVSHSFGPLAVLDEVGLGIAERELVALVGPSGCGKSTLLELVAGLRDPSAGRIAVAGEAAATERLARCAYMPQRDLLFPWLSAVDNAAVALRNRGVSKREARATAARRFHRFGLAGFEDSLPKELSGGMRQRVAFLRTLLARKPVLLLDEPFGSLDTITRAEMQEWLAEALRTEPRTVLLVTHDVEEALYLADRVVVLSARPGAPVAEVAYPAPRGPRTETVTAPAFADLRERALVALAEGRG
jgi:ABC-type nitrate/sulfonate/bicarbonate transport system ATPase subunit